MLQLTELLRKAVTEHASDLHLSAGMPPMLRVHGDMRRMDGPSLDAATIQLLVQQVMTDAQKHELEAHLELDFSVEVANVARFRVNVFHQSRGLAAAFRTIPSKVLSLSELNAPSIFSDLVMKPRGLVLVTGPTGSGKSTTLAAMVDHRNTQDKGHILTIEDPIEFVHESKKSLINQRELGSHTRSFANALRSALREDPDVILVGELRDLETIRLALTAAETGHLVLGTLHTSSAAKAIDRIVDVFPPEEKDIIRTMLSESLEAVIAQVLLKNREGTGRVAAHEILVATSAIRHLIRENKVAQMYSTMQTGSAQGMQTLDQALSILVRQGRIQAAEARVLSRQPSNLI